MFNGAGGGIGGFVVQLAKHAGAHVIATASACSAARIRRLGADQVVDYTSTPVGEAVDRPVDTILNLAPIGPQQAADLIPLARPGGTIVSITVPFPQTPGRTASHFVTSKDMTQLAALVELVDNRTVTVGVTDSYPLTELHQVHRLSEAGQIHGKVTIIL